MSVENKKQKQSFFATCRLFLFLCSLFFSPLVFTSTYLKYEEGMDSAKELRNDFNNKKQINTVLTEDLLYKSLIWAADIGDVFFIKWLLTNGALACIDKVRSRVTPLTPLMYAIYNGHLESANVLIKAGANVNKVVEHCRLEGKFSFGYETALICAAELNSEGAVELLLDSIDDVNYQDHCGMTALMHASDGFHIFALEALLSKSKGIDLNKKDALGRTALMLASGKNSPLAVEALLKHNAQANLQDNEGNTALIWASCGMYNGWAVTISEALLKNGAMVDLSNKNGMTALMLAVEHDNAALVYMLLQYGADPNKKNNAGKSAVDIAEHGCQECLAILENYEMMQFVDERAKEEGLSVNDTKEVIEELKTEETIKRNILKLNEYHENKEIPTKELTEILNGKTPVKDDDNKIIFVESKEKKVFIDIEVNNGDLSKFPVPIISDNQLKKEQIKAEWHELAADSGEILISFVPIVGPPISVAFSQLVSGSFDGTELLKGFVWGAADLVGIGYIKKIKNIEKIASVASKVAAKVKIAKSPGWKMGEDYYKLTSKGTEPAWSTVKSRFWKNKAANLTPEEVKKLEELRFGNVERMKQGKPPQQFSREKFNKYGGDGLESKELHHTPTPRREGGKEVIDLWPKEHELVDKFRNVGY